MARGGRENVQTVTEVGGAGKRRRGQDALAGAGDDGALIAELRQATQWRALRQLLPALAHDVRAPLNTLAINLEVLKALAAPGATEDGQAPALRERSTAALGRAVAQLRDAVDVFLAQALPPVDQAGLLDLGALVEEVAALVRGKAIVQRVSVEIACPDQRIRVAGVGSHVRQAIVNLVLNALAAMPGGGTLSLRLHRDADRAVITVADTGHGMPPEALAEVRAGSFRGGAGGGGVGLLTVRALAEASGGSLAIDSQPGRGTQVALALAVAEER